MRRNLLVGIGAALIGSALTLVLARVHVIPSWSAFNLAAPACCAVGSIVAIIFAHRRKRPSAPQERWQVVGAVCVTLMLVTVVIASLWVALVTQMFGPHPERIYTFEGSRRPLYLFERACFPPDGKAECSEYWTEIRTPIGVLPFTRTITRCHCFYAEPVVTSAMVKFDVADTYVPDTPPALIDPVTMRLLARPSGL
jgi:hypothetical protein